MRLKRWAAALTFAATLLSAGCEKCFHRQPCGATPAPCGCAPGAPGAPVAPPPGATFAPPPGATFAPPPGTAVGP